MLIKDIAPFGIDYGDDDRVYHIIAGAGQSNGYTCGLPSEWPADTLDPAIDISGGRVLQLVNDPANAAYGALIAADEPLKNTVPATGAIGPLLPFARDYYIPYVAPRPDVILIPYYVANTGFVDNRWNPGNDRFNGLCSAIGVALAKYKNSTFKMLDWAQGEKEALAGWTQVQYADAFDAFAAGIRAEFGEVPIIVSGMRPGWVSADAARAPVAAAIADAPNRLYQTGYANPNTSPVIGGAGTGVHYSASEARAMGSRRGDAWTALVGQAVPVTFASASEIQAGTSSTKAAAPYQLALSHIPQTLTDAATIAWNMAAGFNAEVTIAGDRTFATPANPKRGYYYALEVIQGSGGNHLAAWPSSTIFDWGEAGTPVLSTAAGKRDLVYLYCYDAVTPSFRASFSKAAGAGSGTGQFDFSDPADSGLFALLEDI